MSADQEEQYGTDANLAARQRLWASSRRERPFSLFRWVLDLADVRDASGADILDLGCGNGLYERALVGQGHAGRRVALDLSSGMLARVEHALLVQADVQALPLPAATFDVVLAPHMLYHVPDIPTAAREARRVLRAGGVFIAVTNGVRNFVELGELVERAVGAGWSIVRPADRYFSLEDGAAKLTGAFDSVDRVDCPPAELILSDLDVLRGYFLSLRSLYEPEVGRPWDEIVERAMELAAKAADANGEIRLTTSVGAFVCR